MSDHPGCPVDGEAAERARQQALLAAIGAAGPASLGAAAWREQGERAARGLAAYRANAQALAHRALSAACPRLERMLGEEAFPALCAAFWRDHPPQRGDIAEWGDALPEWLAAQATLAEWPWLSDAARMDLALHRAERAADAVLDAASLTQLAEHDPGQLALIPMPGLALVPSVWPIVTIFDAHAATDAAPDLAAVHAALEAGVGETALVFRRGWRAEWVGLDAATACFSAAWLVGHDLGHALDLAAPSGFDFGRWLPRAVTEGWLKGVAVRCD